jgi:hypothetical protein
MVIEKSSRVCSIPKKIKRNIARPRSPIVTHETAKGKLYSAVRLISRVISPCKWDFRLFVIIRAQRRRDEIKLVETKSVHGSRACIQINGPARAPLFRRNSKLGRSNTQFDHISHSHSCYYLNSPLVIINVSVKINLKE